jgi:hypothetical protein
VTREKGTLGRGLKTPHGSACGFPVLHLGRPAGLDVRSLAALTLWETAEALEAAQPVLEGVKRAETSFRRVEAKDTVRFYVAGSRLNL